MLTYSEGKGLGMGVSSVEDCAAKYLRTEGGEEASPWSHFLGRLRLDEDDGDNARSRGTMHGWRPGDDLLRKEMDEWKRHVADRQLAP